MPISVKQFQNIVWDYYGAHGRDLPWRRPEPDGSFDAYKILVSELMLQQTQVSRVIPKFEQFLSAFPAITDLAQSSLGDVLRAWNGLGYNRRAKYLHDAAKELADSQLPWNADILVSLKGIGPNTAAATCAYAYNQPLVFIETNIRSVFLHHFFKGKQAVADSALLPYLEKALDTARPREWYWALMDYGTYLKAQEGNASRRSKHYSRQSAFNGSFRQLRGAILRLLGQKPLKLQELLETIDDVRTPDALRALEGEGLITFSGNYYTLA